MSEDPFKVLHVVTDSEEYKSLAPDTKKMVNGLLSLLEAGVIPPREMALTVMMTATGVTLKDHDKYMELADGGIWHIKGTNDLVIIMGEYVFKVTGSLVGNKDQVNFDELEPM